jgi:hypothetical protein
MSKMKQKSVSICVNPGAILNLSINQHGRIRFWWQKVAENDYHTAIRFYRAYIKGRLGGY